VPGWRFRLEPIWDLDSILSRWRDAERQAGPLHPFATSIFLETWLAAIPAGERPDLVSGEADGGGRCLSLLSQPFRRGRLGLRRTLRALGISGRPLHDGFFLEHYRPLVTGAAMRDATAALLRWLSTRDATQQGLAIPGVDEDLRAVATACWPDRLLEIEERPAFRIDLAAPAVSIDGHPFWGTASGRRAVRGARRANPSADGAILERARDAAEAEAFLKELIELHQARWTARGAAGAFAHHWARQFHVDLARRTEMSRLLRLRQGGRTRAVLFNLRSGSYEANYQSGAAPAAGRDDRPGYLAHLLAAATARDEGVRIYDFMAGENQLKRTFANASYRLNWIEYRPDGAARRIERSLRGIRQALRPKAP